MMLSSTGLDTVSKSSPPAPVLTAYALFISSAFAMFHMVAAGEFSAILTLAVMMQCLGFALLLLQTFSTGSSAGISARALGLDALGLCCRLSSTTWLNGYLPVDASGDYLFQAVDIGSLALVFWLLYRVLVEQRATYQEADDSLPVAPMTIAAFLLAILFHADMNYRPIFDTLWMAGLLVSVVAVLPQMWLITRTGGRVEALTSHYIAAIAFSRALSGIFMWYARFDISCEHWIEGYNHAVWVILGAHLAHLLLLGDFGFYYFKAMATKGLTSEIIIGEEFV